MQCTVWTTFVEPGSEIIQPVLDPFLRQARKHQPPPDAKRPECPFDLAVEIGCPDSGLNRDDGRSMCQTRLIRLGASRWCGFSPRGRAIASLAGRWGRRGLRSRSTRCTVERLSWTLARSTCRNTSFTHIFQIPSCLLHYSLGHYMDGNPLRHLAEHPPGPRPEKSRSHCSSHR